MLFCRKTVNLDTMTAFQPPYLKLHDAGLLKPRIEAAQAKLTCCRLCPRKCQVDRTNPESLGICQTGLQARVSSYHQHFGEEAPLVGRNGSGTIFFTYCNLLCKFCQNFDISHEGMGEEVPHTQLAAMMIALQKAGCHNINFVTPSHVVPQILAALEIAIEEGLSIPLVYNTGAYDCVETLHLLEDIIDIFMPDFKFWDDKVADTTCRAVDYPHVAKKAIREMHRQVGDLVLDQDGIAQRGLLIRHLVLPNGLAGTREIMHFIAQDISPNSYVNVMSQYRPCGRAHEIPQLSRSLADDEYRQAVKAAKQEGITRLDRPKRVFMLW
jgi:putative pyruvate formate lyase activating enzyme